MPCLAVPYFFSAVFLLQAMSQILGQVSSAPKFLKRHPGHFGFHSLGEEHSRWRRAVEKGTIRAFVVANSNSCARSPLLCSALPLHKAKYAGKIAE